MSITASEARPEHWLSRVPMSLFASVMGTGGLGLAWRKAGIVFEVSAWPGELLLLLACIFYVGLITLHVARELRYPGSHLKEFRDARTAAFVPAFSVSTAIVAAAIAPHSLAVAQSIWCLAAGLHAGFALLLLRRWFSEHRPVTELSPAWFIPIVGNLLMPVVGLPLGFEKASWALFGVGSIFWIILAPVMTFRIFFADPLPRHSSPSLFILLAPPSVGALALIGLTGGAPSMLTHALFGFATFIAVLMASLLPRLIDSHFGLSWWALTFPSAAYASLAVSYAGTYLDPVLLWLGLGALAFASLIVAFVFGESLRALIKGELLPSD